MVLACLLVSLVDQSLSRRRGKLRGVAGDCLKDSEYGIHPFLRIYGRRCWIRADVVRPNKSSRAGIMETTWLDHPQARDQLMPFSSKLKFKCKHHHCYNPFLVGGFMLTCNLPTDFGIILGSEANTPETCTPIGVEGSPVVRSTGPVGGSDSQCHQDGRRMTE